MYIMEVISWFGYMTADLTEQSTSAMHTLIFLVRVGV